MELRLEDALEAPVSWQEDLSLAADELERIGLLRFDEGSASGELRSLDAGYLLSARANWRAQVECTRCLEPSEQASEVDFQVVLRAAPNGDHADAAAEADELELEADDLNVVEVVGGRVDPREFVLEQIVLSLPMKALCRENCEGLCPRCGANRNQEACSCGSAPDPRWGALADLKQKMDGN